MDLNELRQQINDIDTQMVDLFVKRMEVAKNIAASKKEIGKAVLDPARERAVLERVTSLAPENMEQQVKYLYQTLFHLSRSYQNQQMGTNKKLQEKIESALANTPQLFPTKAVVACQGVEGAYSQIACSKLFSLPHIMYFDNWDKVFKAVESGLCTYGVLPIENSSYGSVTKVYDLMKQHNFYIVRSLRLKIDHCLLTKGKKDLSEIKEIFSHEQAIGQCSEFLQSLPGVKVTVCDNTAMAAQMVSQSDRDDIAAISSVDCADLYGLQIAKRNITNTDHNYTRFICISKNLEIYPGANRISIMLSVSHKPGTLLNIISRFASLGLNLTKLESRPVPGSDFEFMFYFDFEASMYAPQVLELLNALNTELEEFDYLGSYTEG